MSVKLRISENVRGEVILPVVSDRRLKANTAFVLSDDDYKNPAVQGAINSGYIVIEYDTKQMEMMEKPEENTKVMYDENLSKEIEKLKEEIKKPKIKIKKDGSLKIEILKEDPLLVEQSKINPLIENPSELSSKNEIPPEIKYARQKEEDNLSMMIDLDEMSPRGKNNEKTKMMSWDPESQKMLNKDESLTAVKRQSNSMESEVQTGKINFSEPEKSKPIIEKVTSDKPFTNEKTKEKKEKVKIKVKTKEGKEKTSKKGVKSITPVGESKPEAKAYELGDVEFLETNDTSGVSLDPDIGH